MADATPYNMDAVRSDGFVDFYELLALPQGASTEQAQERIQALYSEAQANRDHRNLNKRRDYQTLLEYLPQARIILPDPAKRALYDDYAARARAGSPPSDFATFVGQLSGQLAAEDNTGLLGRGDTQADRAGSKAGTTSTAPKRPASTGSTSSLPTSRPTPVGAGDGGGVARRPQVKSGPPVAVIAAVVVVLILLVLFFVMKR